MHVPMQISMHVSMHWSTHFVHAYIHTLIQACIHAFIHSFIHACIHAFIHACIHTSMHVGLPYMHVQGYCIMHEALCSSYMESYAWWLFCKQTTHAKHVSPNHLMHEVLAWWKGQTFVGATATGAHAPGAPVRGLSDEDLPPAIYVAKII